jgi:hypothetical protein
VGLQKSLDDPPGELAMREVHVVRHALPNEQKT